MAKNIFFFFQTDRIDGYCIDENGNARVSDIEANGRALKKKYSFDEVVLTGYCHYITAMADAVDKMLIRTGVSDNGLDRIVGACDDNEYKREPSVFKDIIKRNIAEKIEQNGKDKKVKKSFRFEWVDYKNEDIPEKLLPNLIKTLQFNRNDTVYIATNGGPRNNVTFFSVVSQILSYAGVKVHMLYCNRGIGGGEGPDEIITDVDYINDYFDILRGLELFTETGNPAKLIGCCGEKRKSAKIEPNRELDNLFDAMTAFFKSTQLCSSVLGGRNAERKSITTLYSELKDKLTETKRAETSDYQIAIIKQLIPGINRRISPIQNAASNLDFLQIVKWCLDNQMLSNACFIFDAEFPAFFMESAGVGITMNTKERLIRAGLIIDKSKYDNQDEPQTKIAKMITAMNFCKKKHISVEDTENHIFTKRDLSDRVMSNGFINSCGSSNRSVIIRWMSYACVVSQIRNNIAHSAYTSPILADTVYTQELLSELNERWGRDHSGEFICEKEYTPRNSVPEVRPMIDPSEDNFFDIVTFILSCACEDLKDSFAAL